MAHFVVACPETPGHENSMCSLAVELQRRGHEICWIGLLDGRDRAGQWGFHSIVFGEEEFPRGYRDRALAELGRKTGLAAARFTIEQFRRGTEAGLRELPGLIRECRATAFIADETLVGARTVAECTGIPWMSICSALPLHPDDYLPPPGFGWAYGTSTYHLLRNRVGVALFRVMSNSVRSVIWQARRQLGLPPYDVLRDNASRLATIAQIPRDFDFPRRHVPDWFHYVGSLQKTAARLFVDFPFEQLDGRPLIYASMGTVQNRLYPVFRKIAEACEDSTAQLVISMGGGGKPSDLGKLPGGPIVVPYAPQLELLQRADLVVTHGGMNTVTESLAAGVPMLALPVTNDQPGVAARIAWTGCGEKIPLRVASVGRIAAAIKRLLADERYAAKARELGESSRQAGGVNKAADIVEHVLKHGSTAEVSTAF